jgi:hypothetical protein
MQTQELESVLCKFSDIFVKPKGFPPKLSHDHCIPLLQGSAPTNVQPYCYPSIRKTKIGKIVLEMLNSGIIRPGISLYFSLVLLFQKRMVLGGFLLIQGF